MPMLSLNATPMNMQTYYGINKKSILCKEYASNEFGIELLVDNFYVNCV